MNKQSSSNKLKIKNSITNLIIFTILVLFATITFFPNIQSVFKTNKKEPIYNGNRSQNNVSLMINVYWGTEYIEPMLEVFNQYNVSTTFFVGGQWVEKESATLEKIHKAGHEIGNHGYFHREHDKLSYSQNKEEISACHTMVSKIINYNMNLFAPPSGAYNSATIDVADELGYKTIMWSKDTIDWRDKDTDIIFQRATNNVTGGDLILMHPTEATLEALPKILDYYRSNNLTVCTVSQNIGI